MTDNLDTLREAYEATLPGSSRFMARIAPEAVAYIRALEAALTASENARAQAVESEQSMAQLGYEFCDEMGAPRTYPDGSKIGLWLRYGWVQGFRDGAPNADAEAGGAGGGGRKTEYFNADGSVATPHVAPPPEGG